MSKPRLLYIVSSSNGYYPSGADDIVGVRTDLDEAIKLARTSCKDFAEVIEAQLDGEVIAVVFSTSGRKDNFERRPRRGCE